MYDFLQEKLTVGQRNNDEPVIQSLSSSFKKSLAFLSSNNTDAVLAKLKFSKRKKSVDHMVVIKTKDTTKQTNISRSSQEN